MKRLKIIAKVWILVLILTLAFFALIPKDYIGTENTFAVEPVAQKDNFAEKISDKKTNARLPENPESLKDKDSKYNHALLKVDGKNIDLEFLQGESLYDAMLRAQTQNNLSFAGKTFTALGFFVEKIENLEQENDKFLLFYINGKKSDLGVSNYKLISGDQIEWKLE